jgi:hypothetical protein
MTEEDDRAGRSAAALPKVLKVAGGIVAPGTVLTAVLFYFGWLYVFWFCNYFGVNSTVLGLSMEDYLMRSVDGLFVPITVVAGIGLLVSWGRRLLSPRLTDKPRARTAIVIAVAVAGAVLSTIGILTVFGRPLIELGLAMAPLSLAAGVLLLMFASRARRVRRVKPSEWVALAEWSGVFIIVSICAFWAAGDYAGSVGFGRGQQVEAELRSYPNTVLYSAKSLNLTGPGITGTPCANPESAYRYRYDGLKLIMQSGNQYFFLPQDWSPVTGAAIILPRSDSVRLEFTVANSGLPNRTCAA